MKAVPGPLPWGDITSALEATDAAGSAGGFEGRATWQLWKGTSVRRLHVPDVPREEGAAVMLAVPGEHWCPVGRAVLLVARPIPLEWR